MPRLIGCRKPPICITVASETVCVSNRFTLLVLETEVVRLPPLTEDQPTPRDWPAAWLVKWRDR
jgi:hypothetical protein